MRKTFRDIKIYAYGESWKCDVTVEYKLSKLTALDLIETKIKRVFHVGISTGYSYLYFNNKLSSTSSNY